MVGIEVTADGIALAHVVRDADCRPRLALCEFLPCDIAEKRAKVLQRRVLELGLAGTACNLVMAPQEYDMALMEAPGVAIEEMGDALRWQIKDQLTFPVEEAVIDVLQMPEDAFCGRPAMVYVVASRLALVKSAIQFIERSRLELRMIDVRETVLRNIAAMHTEGPRGLALMYLGDHGGMLALVCGDNLFLTRTVDVDLALLADEGYRRARLADQLALDVQRSLDYYESQLGQAPATALLMTPLLAQGADDLKAQLATNLAVPVMETRLPELLETEIDLVPGLQQRCLLAIGAALRQDAAGTTA